MLLQRTSDASRAEASRIQTRMHSHVPQQHQAVSATVARPVCTDSDSETLDAKGRSASLSQNKTNLRSKVTAHSASRCYSSEHSSLSQAGSRGISHIASRPASSLPASADPWIPVFSPRGCPARTERYISAGHRAKQKQAAS